VRSCGFRTVDGGRSVDGCGTVRLPRNPRARPLHSSLRLVSVGFDEFPFKQTTSFGKEDALPPSSPHTGIDNARAQYASPIPRSDAHNIVAANGQATRFLCGVGCRLPVVMAEIWFGLDTGRDPDWRMMRPRPAITDRDGPTLFGPARDAEQTALPQLADIARSAESYSTLKGGESFPGRARADAP
jgi:hypothetical protein